MVRTLALLMALVPCNNFALGGVCERGKLLGSGLKDLFGNAVDLDGSVAVIGEPEFDTGGGFGSGRVRVFRWDGAQWAEEQTLTDSGGALDDRFGKGVAVSGDLIAVGAERDDVGGNTDAGSVHLFRFDGTAWQHEHSIYGAALGDHFGFAVDLSGDVLAIGAYGSSVSGTTGAGAVCVYRYDGTNWQFQQQLTDSSPASGDHFGHGLAVEGNTLVAGAPQDNGLDPGYASRFAWDGTAWNEAVRWSPGNLTAGAQFGNQVAISGNLTIVGAPFHLNNGAVFAFRDSSTISEATLTASDGESDDRFGISLSADGDRAMIGAPRDDDACPSSGFCNSGAAYLFTYDDTGWNEEDKLTASDADSGDLFGTQVALDGMRVMIGANRENENGLDAGAAYGFEVDHTAPVASWTNYGSGCAGTGGQIPSLSPLGNPVLCNDLTLSLGNSSGSLAIAGLFIGVSTLPGPLFSCCPLNVLPTSTLIFVLPGGGMTLGGPVPCDCALAGIKVYTQVFHQDSGGPCGWAASQGLELSLGF